MFVVEGSTLRHVHTFLIAPPWGNNLEHTAMSNTIKLTIKATDIPEVIAQCYLAGIAPLFVGKPGIGKTELTHAAAQRLGRQFGEEFGVHEMHLASYNECDVRGYLVPDGGNAVFTRPDFFATVDKFSRGILFLDEFLQAEHAVQKAIAPLILDRRIGQYQLPPGWMVALAGNGLDDRAGANTLLSHITNRVMYIEVAPPDVDEWVIWAAQNELPPALIAFAKLQPNIVFESDIPESDNTAYCTPRSLTRVGRLANANGGDDALTRMVTTPIGTAMVSGLIGQGAAVALKAAVETAHKIPAFEHMMSDPLKCPVPTALDEQYAAVMLVAVRAKAELHLKSAAQYLLRFPTNILLVGVLALVNRDDAFLDADELMNWAMANRDTLGKFQKFIKLRAPNA